MISIIFFHSYEFSTNYFKPKVYYVANLFTLVKLLKYSPIISQYLRYYNPYQLSRLSIILK